MNNVIAYDLGTGGVKACVFDETSKCMAQSLVEYTTLCKTDGTREQCPLDWIKAMVEATKQLLENGVRSGDISAIALSGHSLGVVAVGRDGELLSDTTPIWSDIRAIQQSDEFFAKIDYEEWYNATGCGFPSHLYSIFKIMWYKDNQRHLYDKTYKFLGTKDYINLFLTGKAATDPSYASGSGVYELTKDKYNDDYIKVASIDKDKLPDIHKSDHIVGKLSNTASEILGLPCGINVACGGVDNACMALGASCCNPEDTYASLGSSAWVSVIGKSPILDIKNKPYVWAHIIRGMYVSCAGIFSSGSSLRWVKDNLFTELEGYSSPYGEIDKLAQASSVGANGLMFLPCLSGGSSVDYSPLIKGALIGLDLGHNKSDMARAVLEGIVFHLKRSYDVLIKENTTFEAIPVVGGGAKSDFWCSIYADVFGRAITRSCIIQNAAALGAAATAFIGNGIWNDYSAVKKVQDNITRFTPDESTSSVYKDIYEIFNEALFFHAKLGEFCKDIKGVL